MSRRTLKRLARAGMSLAAVALGCACGEDFDALFKDGGTPLADGARPMSGTGSGGSGTGVADSDAPGDAPGSSPDGGAADGTIATSQDAGADGAVAMQGDAGAIDAGMDAGDSTLPPGDAGQDATADAPQTCNATCPSGSSCSGAACTVAQGAACGSGPSFSRGHARIEGTVCVGSGPAQATDCTNDTNSAATFVAVAGPATATVTATTGPIQVQETNAACVTPGVSSACAALSAGGSKTFTLSSGTTILAIVSVGACSGWQITY